ncbi:MAG: hypothetical protein ACTHKG_09665 [Nocardioides sp.]
MNRTQTRALLAASWRLVHGPALLVPLLLALGLLAATAPVLDDGYGLRVLRGVGVLLACAWVVTIDDPAGEVTAATPYPRAVRTSMRVAVGSVPLLAGWLVAVVVVGWRAPDVPGAAVGVETLALGVAGLALGAGLRAWRDLHQPAHLAVVGLVALAFLSAAAPRWYALQQAQTWGPPWEAARIRWAALLLVGAGVLLLAVRDPLARSRRT